MTREIRPVQGLLLAGVEGEYLNVDAVQRNRNGLTNHGSEEATQRMHCRRNWAPVCRGGKDPERTSARAPGKVAGWVHACLLPGVFQRRMDGLGHFLGSCIIPLRGSAADENPQHACVGPWRLLLIVPQPQVPVASGQACGTADRLCKGKSVPIWCRSPSFSRSCWGASCDAQGPVSSHAHIDSGSRKTIRNKTN